MLIFGLLVAIASLLIAASRLAGILRWCVIAGILMLSAAIWFGFSITGSEAVARGGTDGPWFRRSPTSEVLMFLAMVIGMSSRYLWDLIELRKRSLAKGLGQVALGFDWLEFLQPLLISAFVFGAILANSKDLTGSTLLFSFQNGFFWQSVIKPKLLTAES